MRQGVIAAISTPPGKGGVAIIRMSGRGAFDIINEVFLPASKKSLGDYAPRTQVYGYIVFNGERLDDCLVTCFPAPHSYTGEDVVEIGCHGGVLVTRMLLEALFATGALPAEAGEFTRRAFINGRLTLTEAEAVGSLLEAKSHEQIRLASEPARVRLNEEISLLRSGLTDILSSIYARIDYPDEDLGDFSDEECLSRLTAISDRLSRLIDTYRTGRAINEGVSAVICGKPNVGKSSLYNLLCGEDAAIVTDIAGTTRDVLERCVPLGRVMLRLADTAGVRTSDGIDPVEKIGISRSESRIFSADAVIALFDLSRPLDAEDERMLELLTSAKGEIICILNKADKEIHDSPRERVIKLYPDALSLSVEREPEDTVLKLTELVDRAFTDEKITVGDVAILSSARQHGALLRGLSFINSAIDGYRMGIPSDAASSDIELALGAISEVDGRCVCEEVVGDIFAKFCVGK